MVFSVSEPLIQYCLSDTKYGYSTLPSDDKRLRHEEIAGSKDLEEQKAEPIIEVDSDSEENFMVSDDMRVDNNRTPLEILEGLKP